MDWGTVELEPEVRDWLERLPTAQFATAAFYVDLLAGQGRCWVSRTPGNWTASCGSCGSTSMGAAVRLTYWIAPGRRIVLLTVFRKTRMREDREVARARRAWQRCMAEAHTVDEPVERTGDG